MLAEGVGLGVGLCTCGSSGGAVVVQANNPAEIAVTMSVPNLERCR
jgi:hypothetical protein